MKALAIDSASSRITFSAQNNEKFSELSLDIGMHQSEKILPSIQYVLDSVNLMPNELDFTSLCLGPGTFTGLRLSFAALKAFSVCFNTPVYGIPSLDAYAFPYLQWKGALVSVIDAKKDRFYATIYRGGKANTEPLDSSVADICKLLDEDESILVVGPDAEYFAEKALDEKPNLQITTFQGATHTCGRQLIDLANKKFVNKEPALQEYDGPVYIRPSEAEVNTK